MRHSIVFLLVFALTTAPFAMAEDPLTDAEDLAGQTQADAQDGYDDAKDDTGASAIVAGPVDDTIEQVLASQGDAAPPEEGATEKEAPSFATRLRETVDGPMMVAGLAGLGVTALGMVGFAAVTRYISPKEALKNPQRAMLYGFIRATPGAHLKQLSEEFKMKTSSILWHIRKLESADLVHSERANGFRVFYPTEGGIEAKRLSRAITALHNDNAQAIQESVNRSPGHSVKDMSERLTIHSGTVRWHLRKLRDFGLIEELVSDEGSRFYPTPLGKQAIEAAVGKPTVAVPAAKGASSAVIGGE